MSNPFTSKFTGFANLLRQVYTLVRPYGRKKLAMVFLVSLFQAFSQVVSVAAVFPFLALAADPSQFENSGIGRWLIMLFPGMSQQHLLIFTGMALVIALFIANGFNLFGEVYRARFTWGFAHWLRMRMLHQMSLRPYSWYLQQNSSFLIKKATQNIYEFVNGILSPIIDGASRFLVTLLLLATIVIAEPKIAFLVALVLGTTYLVVFVLLGRFRRFLSDTLKIHWQGIYQQVGQFITGTKPIKVHGVEEFFLGTIEHHSEKQSRLQAWMPVVSNTPRYLIEPVVAAVFIFLVLKTLASGADAAVLVPGLGLVAMAGYRLLPAVQMLYSQLSTLQTTRYILDEIYEEFSQPESDTAGLAESTVAIAVQSGCPAPVSFDSEIFLDQVRFSYAGSTRNILDNISLTIPKNSVVAFVGETGSGKSTLVDVILGLYKPTGGRILIDGNPLDTDEKIRCWQKSIGYVSQDIFLADDTVSRNIAFGIPEEHIDHEQIRQVAAMAQIADFIENELPDQYRTEVGERGVRLSGGQRQRIALARALYHDPEVLLLDEATSALDHETEERFMDIVYGLVGRFTVIMVAHRLSTIERADVRYRVENGAIISVG